LSSAAPNGRGPGFIEPAEPAIATPLISLFNFFLFIPCGRLTGYPSVFFTAR